MSATQINKELDILDILSSKITDELIENGRGEEKYQETLKKTDPIAIRFIEIHNRSYKLRDEIEKRYGQRIRRLPLRKFFGPIKI